MALAHYKPSEFAIKFMNFIKLVNGEQGESHKTPVMHLAMLDKLAGKNRKIANLCARGTAKTTLFFEYLVLYLAMFGVLPNFGIVTGMLYISDSMDNGVKSARNSIEFRYNNSEFLSIGCQKPSSLRTTSSLKIGPGISWDVRCSVRRLVSGALRSLLNVRLWL